MTEPEPNPPRIQPTGALPAHRILAVALALIGGVAIFVWATHAANNNAWIQLAAALALWALHGYLVTRLWRGT